MFYLLYCTTNPVIPQNFLLTILQKKNVITSIIWLTILHSKPCNLQYCFIDYTAKQTLYSPVLFYWLYCTTNPVIPSPVLLTILNHNPVIPSNFLMTILHNKPCNPWYCFIDYTAPQTQYSPVLLYWLYLARVKILFAFIESMHFICIKFGMQ